MSEQDTTQAEPENDAPEAIEPDDGSSEQEPFDAERAQAKIKKANSEAAALRRRLKELEPLAVKAKELEDASKTEAEKLTERVSAAEKRAAETEMSTLRLEVALDKAPEGAPLAEIRKLAKRLSGSTREELEADAEELFGGVLAAAATRNRRPDPSQGHSSGGAPSLQEQIRAAETSGDTMRAIALKNQLLKSK